MDKHMVDQRAAPIRSPRFGRSLLRRQALISVSILMIGIAVIAVVYNRSTVHYFREQSEAQAQSVLRQTQAALEGKIAQFEHLIRLLYLNVDLQTMLFNEYYYEVPALVASRQITSHFAPVYQQLGDLFADVDGVTVYTVNNTLRHLPDELEPLANVTGAQWYREAEEEEADRTLWMLTESEEGEPILSAVHRLRNLRISSFSANFLGYIKMDFALERFFDRVLIASGNETDWLLVTGDKGELLASSPGLGTAGLDALLLQADPSEGVTNAPGVSGLDADINEPSRTTLMVEGIPFIAWSMPVSGTYWTCWYGISEQVMLDAMRRVNLPILLVAAFMTAGMAGAFWFATSRLTGRIGRLANAMGQLEEGNFSIRVHDHREDEIRFLSDGFNNMADRLGVLVQREYLARMRQREYDLSALQAQLHPHFLYNTLASISWLGMRAGMAEIPAISNALARFYRLSLSKGQNFIRVADEISQVSAYLEIMAIRYKDKIELDLQVPEETSSAWTLKLILQPFVENAILHGMSAEKKQIRIEISVKKEEEALSFVVKDDGIGIPQDKMPDFQSGGVESGYGITNVNQRIRTYFGEENGVSMRSVEGGGTTVTIRIPWLRQAPETTVKMLEL